MRFTTENEEGAADDDDEMVRNMSEVKIRLTITHNVVINRFPRERRISYAVERAV